MNESHTYAEEEALVKGAAMTLTDEQLLEDKRSLNRKRLIENQKDALDLQAERIGLEFDEEDGVDDGGMY